MFYLVCGKCQNKATKAKSERESKNTRSKTASVAPPDRLSRFIHYSLNAGRCQLYYCRAVLDWRPQVGGEKSLHNAGGCTKRKQGSSHWWMGMFDPGRVEGSNGSLPDETGSRQSLCPSDQTVPALSAWAASCSVLPVGASISCVKTGDLHIQQMELDLMW